MNEKKMNRKAMAVNGVNTGFEAEIRGVQKNISNLLIDAVSTQGIHRYKQYF